MLVPAAAWGKPLQFQVTKRTLVTLLSIAAVSVLLVLAGSTLFVVSAFTGKPDQQVGMLDSPEQAARFAALQEENQQLKEGWKSHIKTTQEKISQVSRLVDRISEFTGLPLEVPTTATAALTSESTLIGRFDKLGRGGPLTGLPDASLELFLGHKLDDFADICDAQILFLNQIEVRLEYASRHFSDQQQLLVTTPLICPVQSDEYVFTDRFGNRVHPLYRRTDFHNGLDVAAAHNSPIVAPADGVVTYAGYNKGMGRTLTIDHGTGLYPRDGVISKKHFKTRYFHCSKVLLKKGAKVKRGDVIALVGSTGISTGNHLHYEVLVEDKPVDPEFFILNGR